MDHLNVPFKIAELIFKELCDDLSVEEASQLKKWKKSAENQKLYEKIINEQVIKAKLKAYESFNKSDAWDRLSNKRLNSNRRFVLWKLTKYAAAILLPLIIGTSVFYMLKNADQNNSMMVEAIQPGVQKATLTLADGERFELENTREQLILSEEHVDIVDKTNRLQYHGKGVVESTHRVPEFNTLETPRGGEYSLMLADGTKVWLNAATKITYPVYFSGDTRQVFIEGEAYFEVAHDAKKPFIVSASQLDIGVLGTAFNLMAYADEPDITTTLVVGKIEVRANMPDGEEINMIMHPGDQAILNKEIPGINNSKVDTEAYTAWKDGRFVMVYEPLDRLMRRLGRWYNFETSYETEELKNVYFSGTLNKYDDISKVLDIIGISAGITFNVEGDTVRASKKNS